MHNRVVYRTEYVSKSPYIGRIAIGLKFIPYIMEIIITRRVGDEVVRGDVDIVNAIFFRTLLVVFSPQFYITLK